MLLRNSLSKIIHLGSHSKKYWWFLLIALFFKGAFFIYKLSEGSIENDNYPDSFGSEAGDTGSYLFPIDNLVTNGVYEDDYRMPGYGWLYFILRLFVSSSISLNIIVISQLLLSAVSVYVLALVSKNIFQSNGAFIFTFIVYCLSTYVSLFDHMLLTESFSTSSLIFGFYYLLCHNHSKIKLVWAGLFFTWSIFLKPVLLPIFFLAIIYLFVTNKDKVNILSYRLRLKFIGLFVLPFLILDGIWVIRNYTVNEKFQPLNTSFYSEFYFAGYKGSMFQFVQSFGGSIVFWKPNSEISFFMKDVLFENNTPPVGIYNETYNSDSLFNLKNQIFQLENSRDTLDELTLELKEEKISNTFKKYQASLVENNAFLFQISSRAFLFKSFLFHSGTYNLFNQSSEQLGVIKYGLKLFYSALYLIVISFGFIGALFILFQRKINYSLYLLCFISFYLALVFPIALRLDEYRYFVTAYPFFVLCLTYLVVKGFKKNSL